MQERITKKISKRQERRIEKPFSDPKWQTFYPYKSFVHEWKLLHGYFEEVKSEKRRLREYCILLTITRLERFGKHKMLYMHVDKFCEEVRKTARKLFPEHFAKYPKSPGFSRYYINQSLRIMEKRLLLKRLLGTNGYINPITKKWKWSGTTRIIVSLFNVQVLKLKMEKRKNKKPNKGWRKKHIEALDKYWKELIRYKKKKYWEEKEVARPNGHQIDLVNPNVLISNPFRNNKNFNFKKSNATMLYSCKNKLNNYSGYKSIYTKGKKGKKKKLLEWSHPALEKIGLKGIKKSYSTLELSKISRLPTYVHLEFLRELSKKRFDDPNGTYLHYVYKKVLVYIREGKIRRPDYIIRYVLKICGINNKFKHYTNWREKEHAQKIKKNHYVARGDTEGSEKYAQETACIPRGPQSEYNPTKGYISPEKKPNLQGTHKLCNNMLGGMLRGIIKRMESGEG